MTNVPTWAYVIGVLGVGGMASAIVTYVWAPRRTTSGRIDTTEASKLWDANEAFQNDIQQDRKELREELVALRLRLAEMETKLAEANARSAELRLEVLELRHICGITNEGVELIQREMSAVTPRRRRR